MSEFDPGAPVAETVMGAEPEVAVEMEDITDALWQLTRDAMTIALTGGETDQHFGWMRKKPARLDDGTLLTLVYTIERPEDNYASVIQEIPDNTGGRKIIERRWSNTNPSDKSLQKVNSVRLRPHSQKLENHRQGFNPKDITRLKKLLDLLRNSEEASGQS